MHELKEGRWEHAVARVTALTQEAYDKKFVRLCRNYEDEELRKVRKGKRFAHLTRFTRWPTHECRACMCVCMCACVCVW